MTVNNGTTANLLIGGVHNGMAGVQDSATGVTVAFVPNLGRIGKVHVGTGAVLGGKSYRIARVTSSPVTAGFVRVDLEEPQS